MTKGEQAVKLRNGGMSNAEIAEKLGMPVHSVRRLISSTRRLKRKAAPPREVRPQEPVIPDTNTGHQTIIVIPDTQCKPGVDLDHLKWAGEYIAERQPDVVVQIGDHYDMESLSQYDKGKKAFEGRRYKADIEAGDKGIDLLMEGIARCRKQPRLVFTLGNHEERIARAIEDDPRLEGLIGYHDLKFAAYGWEVIDYLRPIEIGGIWHAHYFYNPMSGHSYSGTAEQMLKNIGYSFTMGHQQGLRFARRELGNGAVQIGLIAGSFYSHEEQYKGPQGNRHWRGIVVQHEVKDGAYDPMFVSLDFLKRKFKKD